jgi:hypothetical protein
VSETDETNNCVSVAFEVVGPELPQAIEIAVGWDATQSFERKQSLAFVFERMIQD